MTIYLTPGVYRTTQVATQSTFALVRTDIAGFVGFAERGPLPEDFPQENFDAAQVALKITSWAGFQAQFGSFQSYGYLAYAVRAFFENGGNTCYVVRVAATTAQDLADRPATASFTLPSGPAVQIGTLGQIADPFHAEFKPSSGAESLLPGNLVRIDSGGITQINHVVATEANSSILWAAKLEAHIQSGATISRFPPACTIAAASRGNWGNRIRVRITPLDGIFFALRATVDLGPNSLPKEDEFYRRLTLADPTADNYAPRVLQQQSNLVRMDSLTAAPILLGVDQNFASGEFYLQGGRDGLAKVSLRDFAGGSADMRGLRLLEDIDEVGILSIPDAVFRGTPPLKTTPPPVDPCQPPPSPKSATIADDPTAVAMQLTTSESLQLQRLMIDQCERLNHRFALIDPPDGLQIADIQNWPSNQGLVMRSSRFAAIYYPWMKVPDSPGAENLLRRVPPSGHIAGVYAKTDLTHGVQRPPANVALEFVDDVAENISDLQQAGLNENNINAIRNFPGRGIRVWGARSLALPEDSDWRFIHIRRLMSAIEETVKRSSQWAVFQSNDEALRNTLKHSLAVLLEGLWASGGLKGAKPEDSFYVKCDATNNPPYVIDQGRLVCEVGVAVAAPMEFIVFEIRQDASGGQVLES